MIWGGATLWLVANLCNVVAVPTTTTAQAQLEATASSNKDSRVDDPLSAQSLVSIPATWFNFENASIPTVTAMTNVTALETSLSAHVQYATDDGSSGGTPLNFTVFSGSLQNGRWEEQYGCCSGRWWDVHRRYNPEVAWDGTPEGTFSMVIVADDIDENAQIHWLVVNIDPREHYFKAGKSGRCNWWQMLYRRCPRGRIPASAVELPNRWGQWRYTAFCPPKVEDHRYRIRVFAQSEWDQSYLDIRHTGWALPPVTRSSDDIVRQLMKTNLAVGTIIGKFQRPHSCGGPMYTDGGPPDQIEGLVADYDFSTKTLFSMVEGSPAIVDIGASCGRAGHFANDNPHQKYSPTFDFLAGNGLKIPDVDLLLKKDDGDNSNSNSNSNNNAFEYTLVMDVKLRRTSCWVRLLTIKPSTADDFEGLYSCYGMYVYPAGARSGYIPPEKWTHMAIAVNAERQVRLYVDGKKHFDGKLSDRDFRSLKIMPGAKDEASRKQPGAAPYMALFNYCGDTCNCLSGGLLHSSGRVRQIQLYNRMVEDKDVELMFARAIFKETETKE